MSNATIQTVNTLDNGRSMVLAIGRIVCEVYNRRGTGWDEASIDVLTGEALSAELIHTCALAWEGYEARLDVLAEVY